MKNNKKINLIGLRASLVLYIVYVFCLFMLHPFVASAEEKVPGGFGNTVVVSSIKSSVKDYGDRSQIHFTTTAGADSEIVAYLSEFSSTPYILVDFVVYKKGNSTYYSLSNTTGKSLLSDYVGTEMIYEEGTLTSSKAYTLSTSGGIPTSAYYCNKNDEFNNYNCVVSGCKIFSTKVDMENYIKNGSLDGMLKPEDDVDSGELDYDIGYLHNLQHKSLLYGEQDENGIYSNYDDRFTWSDYYPEYDDSYLVEVRASCEVEVRKWFGIGKSTVYNSNIRKLADNVPYKDLEYIVGLDEQKALFADFLNEYMPGNDSVSDVISAATYQFDAYYFRIYRWDEETQTYKYGLWVRLTKDGSALDATLNTTVDAGELDDEGNWKQKADSDYGKGKNDTTIVGSGDDQETAKSETDRKQEEKDNGGKQLDLSNTNFQELWEWFTGVLLTFWNSLGVVPDFFARLFSFLPSPVIGLIAGAIVVAVVLRVLGR